MKECVLLIMVLIFMFCFSSGFAASYDDLVTLAAQYEPQPFDAVSAQESNPFTPMVLNPEAFMDEIEQASSAAQLDDYFQSIGLPVDSLDSEFILNYNYSSQWDRFEPVPSSPSIQEITIVSYTFPEQINDNIVFLFVQNQNAYVLTDILTAFGEIQLVQDEENIWLVGRTSPGHQTVRWYHVNSQRIVLLYLAKGWTADRVDYHFYAESCVDPLLNQNAFEEDSLLILMQIGVMDFTQPEHSNDGQKHVLYTKAMTYTIEEDGTFILTNTVQYDGLDIEAVKELLTPITPLPLLGIAAKGLRFAALGGKYPRLDSLL